MNKKYLGTKYGGWTIDVDSISDGDVIIDGGLGEDISFDIELNKLKPINIVGIDPTIKSHKFIEGINLPNLKLIKKAVGKVDGDTIKLYKNTNPKFVSESTTPSHKMVSNSDYHEVETVSIKTLINDYNPSLIKLDIEGSEYEVLSDCVGVKQICVEFHHNQISTITINDTMNKINMLKNNGYDIIHTTPDYQEVTFLKK
jgi:FkbM family methyltransferase